MNKIYFIRQFLPLLLTSFTMATFGTGIEKRSQIKTLPFTQQYSLPSNDRKLIAESLLPDQDKLVDEGAASTVRLDSIYEDLSTGLKMVKRKWLYHYNNDKLYSMEHLYFSKSYENQLSLSETTWYNEEGQISRYEQKDQLVDMIDSIFTETLEVNSYDGDNLVLKTKKSYRGGSTEGVMVNGKLVITFIINYSYDTIHYQYNEKNLLIREYYQDGSQSTEYTYDNQDRLLFKINKGYLGNIDAITKHTCTETDSTKFNTVNTVYYQNITEVNLDTITTWLGEFDYEYVFNEQEQLKKQTIIFIWFGADYNGLKAFYSYDPSGYLTDVSIYYQDSIMKKDGTWIEQDRINYTYNEDGKLRVFHRMYYDDREYCWKDEEVKTYYYSPIGTATATKAMTQNVFHCYPNPAKDYICLSTECDNGVKFIIYNLSGEKKKEGKVENRLIPVADLQKGTYFIRVCNQAANSCFRFMKN